MTQPGQKKRVLIVCQHFWPESFRINDIADFLANEKDCDVEILCGLPNYPSGKLFQGYSLFGKRKDIFKDIPIRRVLEIPRGNNSTLRIFLNYISFPLFSIFHIPRLLTNQYDEIFLYQLSPVMMSYVGIMVGKIKRIPTTMYVLDLWPENLYSVLDIKNTFLRKIIASISNWHYKNTDQLIALSEIMQKRLITVTGKNEKNVIVLPQAAEKIYESNIKDTVLIDRFQDTFNVVYTGNISPAQSFETIIESAEELVTSGITDIHWIIVGDGMSKRNMEKLVKNKHLESFFSFEGQKEPSEIPKYTYIADVLIGSLAKSALLEATIPAKVVSYIAAGKPIVLAMDGEVQELINVKIQCGYAGNAGDKAILSENLKKIYNDTDKQRELLGARAKEYYSKHLNRTVLLNRLYNFIFQASKV